MAVRSDSGKMRRDSVRILVPQHFLGKLPINGGLAGFAQHELEARYEGAIAQFVQGCGADINPLPRYQGTNPSLAPYSVALPQMYGKILAAAVDITLHETMKPLSGPVSAAFRRVDLPFHRPPDRTELTRRLADKSPANASVRRHAEYMLSIIERDGKLPDHYPYPVQAWEFGKDLAFVALGGEVVVDYSLG